MFKLYVTESAPNGTAGIYVCDSYDQIKGFIDEAVFGLMPSFEDALGNISANFYGESIGMVDYSTPYDEDSTDEDAKTLAEAVLAGETELEPVAEVTLDEVLEHLCCSPVDPNGENILAQLKKLKVIKE